MVGMVILDIEASSLSNDSYPMLMPLDQAVSHDKRSDLAARLATVVRPHRALADCQMLAQIVREVRAGV